MRAHVFVLFVAVWSFILPASLHAQVCGNGVREGAEQCDDGNTRNGDGCSAQCKFEQNQRINALQVQFTTPTLCSSNANQLGAAIVDTTLRTNLQTALDNSIASGATSVIMAMLSLDDLAGFTDPSLQVGMVNGTPLTSPSAYNGTSDPDWWYVPAASDVDADVLPISKLGGSIASGVLTAGPGSASVGMDLFGSGVSRLAMSALQVRASIGATSKPAISNGSSPGHLASENIDPALTSYATSGTNVSGEMCGNVSAASLASTAVPQSMTTTTACIENYTSANTMLDVIVGGCKHLNIFTTTVIAATQPDQTVSGNAIAYRFGENSSHHVTSCTANGSLAPLSTCLADAAYSSYFKFSTDRVIEKPVPAPVASNDGPVCAGSTVQLTATGQSGTYQWTGPNGFTSTLQNPSIPSATTAASGTYDVTVTLAGSTSAAGTTTVTVNAIPGTPVVNAPPSTPAGAPGLAASVAQHAGSTYAWSVTNGRITTGQGTNQITFTAGNSGSVGLSVTETNSGCASSPGTASVSIVFGTPQNVLATAGSLTSVNVRWTATVGAVSYEVTRQGGGATAVVGTPTTAVLNDTTAVANTAYLYTVRAVDGSNNHSGYSVPDLATTVIFTDDPLVAGSTVVKASHLLELQTAVHAVQTLAGQTQTTFDGSLAAGTPIKAGQINELRTALDAARSALALPPMSYTDPSLVAGVTVVKAAHVQELRTGLQ